MSERPIPRRWRVARRRAAIAGILVPALISTGCTTWIEKNHIHETWDDVQVVRERVTGEPERRVVPHADGLGWTVEVREPIEQTLARTGRRTWKGRKAYVAPGFSLLVAAVGCGAMLPLGTLMLAITPIARNPVEPTKITRDITDTCFYPLIGLIPDLHWNNDTGSEPIAETDHSERGWRPVSQAEVGIRRAGEQWIRSALDEAGRASLRVDRLPLGTIPSEPTPVELGLWVRDKQIAEWAERIDPVAWQRLKDEPVIPAERWPKRVIVGLLPWQGLPDASRERWEQRFLEELTRATLIRGGQLVPLLPAARQAVEFELTRQYSGNVADETQVSLGRRAGATLLVRPSAKTNGAMTLVGADVLVVETGEILASVGWEVPNEAVESALEAVVARVGRTVGQAPRR